MAHFIAINAQTQEGVPSAMCYARALKEVVENDPDDRSSEAVKEKGEPVILYPTDGDACYR